jgi:hypothetical protein
MAVLRFTVAGIVLINDVVVACMGGGGLQEGKQRWRASKRQRPIGS